MPSEVILAALRQAWTALAPIDVRMAVMGGLALATWGHVRSTQDVDLLVALEGANLDEALRRLYGNDFRPKREPPLVRLDQQEIVQLHYAPPELFCEVQVDLLLVSSPYQLAAIGRSVPTHLPGLDLEIAVLACEDMILHKLLANRIIDQADAAMLLRENRSSLDLSYLSSWVATLSLERELAGAWREAFPDETQ